MEGMNSLMTYCKNFSKCHNVSPVQKNKTKFKKKKTRKEFEGRVSHKSGDTNANYSELVIMCYIHVKILFPTNTYNCYMWNS
jgi:hypothetical protein